MRSLANSHMQVPKSSAKVTSCHLPSFFFARPPFAPSPFFVLDPFLATSPFEFQDTQECNDDRTPSQVTPNHVFFMLTATLKSAIDTQKQKQPATIMDIILGHGKLFIIEPSIILAYRN